MKTEWMNEKRTTVHERPMSERTLYVRESAVPRAASSRGKRKCPLPLPLPFVLPLPFTSFDALPPPSGRAPEAEAKLGADERHSDLWPSLPHEPLPFLPLFQWVTAPASMSSEGRPGNPGPWAGDHAPLSTVGGGLASPWKW